MSPPTSAIGRALAALEVVFHTAGLDVVAILRARRDALDLDRVRELLGMLEEALGQSDLLLGLENALRGAGGR